jgi:hypothetical protein
LAGVDFKSSTDKNGAFFERCKIFYRLNPKKKQISGERDWFLKNGQSRLLRERIDVERGISQGMLPQEFRMVKV